jgi:hypothetical protein
VPQPDDLLKHQIKERDHKHLDPSERAEFVNTFFFHALGLDSGEDFVENPLYWDLIMYANEMILLYAFGIQDEQLLALMKHVNSHLYSLHYSIPGDSPELGPSRDEHKRVWEKRIEDYT